MAFVVPRGWVSLDAGDALEGQESNPAFADMAKRMGMEPEQLLRAMGSVDLLIVDGGGVRNGFLDNINAIGGHGNAPNDTQIKLQILQLGAQFGGIDHRTQAGGTSVANYSMVVAEHRIFGRALVAPTEDGFVWITVTSRDRARLEQLAELVLDSLAPTTGSGTPL
jgi:hypothetical protein